MFTFVLGLIVGFIVGALVARNNKSKADAIVAQAEAAKAAVQDKLQK